MSLNVNLVDKISERVRSANETLPDQDFAFPLYIIVEPTNNCNLSCVMCPSSIQTRPRGTMSMKLWKKIVDEIACESPQSFLWPAVMGESLLVGDIFLNMLEYAGGQNLNIIWNTNALLLTDEWIDRIAKMGLREIIVGMDAFTPATYAAIRRGGDYDIAVANTKKLIEYCKGKTKITVQFIEQEANFREKDDFMKFWLAQGAAVKIRPRLGWGTGVEAPSLILKQDERFGPCPWLIRTVSIHWNGAVVQCDADWDQRYKIGDMKENTLKEIWTGELKKRRTKHKNKDFDFEPCKTCNDWQAGLSQFYYPDEKNNK